MAVPGQAGLLDPAGGHLERGEQGGGAVADVVVGLLLRHPGHDRQDRRGPVQGLDLRLLVDTEHDGLLRRVQIQPDDVADLRVELGVGGELERLGSATAADPTCARSGPPWRRKSSTPRPAAGPTSASPPDAPAGARHRPGWRPPRRSRRSPVAAHCAADRAARRSRPRRSGPASPPPSDDWSRSAVRSPRWAAPPRPATRSAPAPPDPPGPNSTGSAPPAGTDHLHAAPAAQQLSQQGG